MNKQVRSNAERSAESARRLLQACIELVAEQGFDRTTAAEIGERAGYSRAMVGFRYGSKEQLLETMFDVEVKQRLLPPTDAQPGLSWLQAHIDQAIELVETERLLAQAISVLIFESVGPVHALRGWYRRWMVDYQAELARQLRAGVHNATIRAEIDIDREADDLMTYGIGLCFRWVMDFDNFDFIGELRAWQGRLNARYAP